jgi:aerobic carbon-monoxide dehydrogenase medium subunit
VQKLGAGWGYRYEKFHRTAQAWATVGVVVADQGTNPPADLHGAPDYRRHLARVLTGRALEAAAGV